MNTNINSFIFGVNPIRVIDLDGKPWFVASDVARTLGYANPQKAVRDHCKGVNTTDTPTSGGMQSVRIIPESDVYRLVMRSQMPDAERFQDWVVDEVIPSIRRTGGYQMSVPKTLPEALRQYAAALEEKQVLELKVLGMEPKADFHDAVVKANEGQSIRDAAKVLGTGQNRLFQWLREHRVLMNDNTPYQEYIERGYFKTIQQTWQGKTSQHLATKTVVTGKGLVWLQRTFQEAV